MALPADPAAFIAEAERCVNERDVEATVAAYAQGGRLEAFTDGALETYEGAGAIRRGWSGYLAAMDARGFTLKKRMTAIDGDTIVNEWSGSLGGRTEAEGIERWTFDDDGKVREHRMYSYLNVKPSKSPLQRLRLGLAYPATAFAFLREQRRAGGG